MQTVECEGVWEDNFDCLELAAVFEMGRRWSRLAPDELKVYKVTNSEAAYRIFKTVLTPGDDKENLYALLLNNKNCPLCEPLRISRGTADSAPAFARDVFKEALKWGAVAVMVAHNHPSGDPTPSKADFRFTEQLVALAKIAEIRFLDHLVLGDGDYISIRSLGEIAFD
ncbi:MAG: RadC family protein [Kiritimatiellia bacterium]